MPRIRSLGMLAAVPLSALVGLAVAADPAGHTEGAEVLAAPTVSVPFTASTPPPTTATSTTTSTTTSTATSTTSTLVPPDLLLASDRRLVEIGQIGGEIAPKSIVSTQHGLFFAQNMMYRHTITVYDRAFSLVSTISDQVDLPSYGYPELPGGHRGAPVEAAVTADGSVAYVSNYEMAGPGLTTGAGDDCDDSGWPDSYVYRIPTDTLTIDGVIRVGAVPKFLAVTPDERLLLVSNWCSFDLSVIDLETFTEVARIEVGRHPRGIVVSPDSTTAYVAVMGSRQISVIDLRSLLEVRRIDAGNGPRHLVLAPDGATLYATLNGAGRVVKIDAITGTVLASVATGSAPRSMAISDDGSALYVVNYEGDTMSKVRTGDMAEVEEHATGHHPIGVTYDVASRQVWVANYSGTIQIFEDRIAG